MSTKEIHGAGSNSSVTGAALFICWLYSGTLSFMYGFSYPGNNKVVKGKVVAFDFGERRVGAASGMIEIGVATGLQTISFQGRKDLRICLEELISTEEPEQIVVGYPLNMDGSRGERCEAVEKFAGRLKGWFELPVVLWDERMTSSQAERIQREAGVSDRKARAEGLLDRASAILILQSWLDSSDRRGIVLDKEGE